MTKSSRGMGDPAMKLRTAPTVVQVCRHIGPGGGVSGVAHQLEQELMAMGYDCRRLTAETLRRGNAKARRSQPRIPHHLALAVEVVWFSLRATWAIRRLRGPDSVVITHNDALGGDIYINHGLHKALMAERGWRATLRNPLHLFLLVREELRHRLGLYRVAVCLSGTERRRLERFYRVKRPVEVIPNGVDTARFSPLSPTVRGRAREEWGVAQEEFVLAFVGHEFERKGLAHVLHAMRDLPPNVRLWVLGGTLTATSAWRTRTDSLDLGSRVTYFGVRPDVEAFLQRADALVLISTMEASPLVVLEAMACGLPCFLSPDAAAGDVLEPGESGMLAAGGDELAKAVGGLSGDPELQQTMATHARQAAEAYAWPEIARRYDHLILETWRARQGDV